MTMLHRQFTALRLHQIALQLDNAAVCCPTLTEEQRERLQGAYEAVQGVAEALGADVLRASCHSADADFSVPGVD